MVYTIQHLLRTTFCLRKTYKIPTKNKALTDLVKPTVISPPQKKKKKKGKKSLGGGGDRFRNLKIETILLGLG